MKERKQWLTLVLADTFSNLHSKFLVPSKIVFEVISEIFIFLQRAIRVTSYFIIVDLIAFSCFDRKMATAELSQKWKASKNTFRLVMATLLGILVVVQVIALTQKPTVIIVTPPTPPPTPLPPTPSPSPPPAPIDLTGTWWDQYAPVPITIQNNQIFCTYYPWNGLAIYWLSPNSIQVDL